MGRPIQRDVQRCWVGGCVGWKTERVMNRKLPVAVLCVPSWTDGDAHRGVCGTPQGGVASARSTPGHAWTCLDMLGGWWERAVVWKPSACTNQACTMAIRQTLPEVPP